MKLLLPTRQRRLTAAGWLWLLVSSVMLALGIGKNINLLTLLGMVLLAVLLLNAAAAGRRLTTLRGHRHLADLLFAGSLAHVEARLHGAGARGVRVEDGP